jgi:hypothetical protein
VVPVEPEAENLPAHEPLRQAPKGVAVLIDDRHTVAVTLERDRQFGANSPATHNHDMHGDNCITLGVSTQFAVSFARRTSGR